MLDACANLSDIDDDADDNDNDGYDDKIMMTIIVGGIRMLVQTRVTQMMMTMTKK